MSYKLMNTGGMLLMTFMLNAVTPDVALVEERTNIRSDRRPVPVGYYDEKADKTFVFKSCQR